MNKLNRILILQHLSWLLAALLLTQNALADNKDENDIPWYQIEVIIFANQNYLGLTSETWPDPPSINVPQFIELHHPDDVAMGQPGNLNTSPASNMPTPYELLGKSQLQLTPVVKKLEASSKYQPLLHIGWRQPTLSPDDAKPVIVFQGVELPMSAYATRAPQSQIVMKGQSSKGRFSSVPVGTFTVDSSQYGQLMPVSETDLITGPDLNPLYGTLRLSVSRYLHLEVNLNYRIPVMKEEVVPVDPEQGFMEGSFRQNLLLGEGNEAAETKIVKHEVYQNFNLHETRRMRSKEIHYFDHPVIGIVSRVIPYEIPKVEPDFDPASQAFKSGQPAPQR